MSRQELRRFILTLVATFGLATLGPVGASATANAASGGSYVVAVEPGYGPAGSLTDGDSVKISVYLAAPPATPVYFDCNTVAYHDGNQIYVTTSLYPGAANVLAGCAFPGQAFVGPLPIGSYGLSVRVYADSGMVKLDSTFTVVARGAKCNPDPHTNGLIVTPAQALYRGVDDFIQRYQTDSAFRAQFGDIIYTGVSDSVLLPTISMAFPTLDDPVRELSLLRSTGQFLYDELNGPLCFSPPPPDGIAPAVEYYNTLLDHYFITPDAGEQAAIDAGQVGPGWMRTGKSFNVIVYPGCPFAVEGGFHPVYRFAGIPNIGPNSHFFTASEDECAVVRDRADWHWQFEGAPFWASEPVRGACGSATRPVYRVYNNGKGGTPNHRYTTDAQVVTQMLALGWVDEGAVMCVPAR
jgi:hypothetical protein